MGCSQSMVSEHALERRRDPWDGKTETLEEMVKKYQGTYSKVEVESYFEFECTVASVPAPASKVQENSDDILQELKDLPAPGNMGCLQSMVSEHALERRRDPWDGNTETLEEMVKKYQGTYSKAEVESYFEFECTVASVPAPASKVTPARALAASNRLTLPGIVPRHLRHLLVFNGQKDLGLQESPAASTTEVPKGCVRVCELLRSQEPDIDFRLLRIFEGRYRRLQDILSKNIRFVYLQHSLDVVFVTWKAAKAIRISKGEAPETSEDNADGDVDAPTTADNSESEEERGEKNATPFLVEELTEEGVKIAHESICARSVKELQQASQDLVEQFTEVRPHSEEPRWPEWLFCCFSRPSKQLEVVKMDEPKEVSVAKVVEVEPADDSDSSDSSDSEKKPKKKANSDSSSDERRKRKKSDSSDDGAKKKAKVKAKNSSSSEARKDSSDDEEEKAKKDDSSDDEKKKAKKDSSDDEKEKAPKEDSSDDEREKAKKDSSDDEKEKAKKDSSDEEEKKKELLRPKSDMAPSEALEEPQWPWFEWLQLPGLSWIF